MIIEDLHTHSLYCDGKNTLEEMVEGAIKKGLHTLGFSPHGYTRFDLSYCMTLENTKKYIKEVKYIKEKYKRKIKLLMGIELDYFTDIKGDDFDYLIGSVHYVETKKGEKVAIDESGELVLSIINNDFNSDVYLFCEKYFEMVSDIVDKTSCDIIGHFDLITKFKEVRDIIDFKNERYVNAYKKAIDKLVLYDKVFEINTGAISRGYKDDAYPSEDILKYLCEKNAKVIITGDTHHKDNIAYEYEKYYKLALDIGFKKVCISDDFIKQKVV